MWGISEVRQRRQRRCRAAWRRGGLLSSLLDPRMADLVVTHGVPVDLPLEARDVDRVHLAVLQWRAQVRDADEPEQRHRDPDEQDGENRSSEGHSERPKGEVDSIDRPTVGRSYCAAMASIGFIGLGVMGYPMAGHLQKAGHSVTVYNRTTAKADAWAVEMAALRTPAIAAPACAPTPARRALGTNAPTYTPAPVSVPVSTTVRGVPPVTMPAYAARVERLGAHAATTAAATAPPPAAAPAAATASAAAAPADKKRHWFQKLQSKVAAPKQQAAMSPAPVPVAVEVPLAPLLAPELSGSGAGASITGDVVIGGGEGLVPRSQRLVAAAMAVSVSISKGLPTGAKRAAAFSWLLLRR